MLTVGALRERYKATANNVVEAYNGVVKRGVFKMMCEAIAARADRSLVVFLYGEPDRSRTARLTENRCLPIPPAPALHRPPG